MLPTHFDRSTPTSHPEREETIDQSSGEDEDDHEVEETEGEEVEGETPKVMNYEEISEKFDQIRTEIKREEKRKYRLKLAVLKRKYKSKLEQITNKIHEKNSSAEYFKKMNDKIRLLEITTLKRKKELQETQKENDDLQQIIDDLEGKNFGLLRQMKVIQEEYDAISSEKDKEIMSLRIRIQQWKWKYEQMYHELFEYKFGEPGTKPPTPTMKSVHHLKKNHKRKPQGSTDHRVLSDPGRRSRKKNRFRSPNSTKSTKKRIRDSSSPSSFYSTSTSSGRKSRKTSSRGSLVEQAHRKLLVLERQQKLHDEDRRRKERRKRSLRRRRRRRNEEMTPDEISYNPFNVLCV